MKDIAKITLGFVVMCVYLAVTCSIAYAISGTWEAGMLGPLFGVLIAVILLCFVCICHVVGGLFID